MGSEDATRNKRSVLFIRLRLATFDVLLRFASVESGGPEASRRHGHVSLAFRMRVPGARSGGEVRDLA